MDSQRKDWRKGSLLLPWKESSRQETCSRYSEIAVPLPKGLVMLRCSKFERPDAVYSPGFDWSVDWLEKFNVGKLLNFLHDSEELNGSKTSLYMLDR